MLEEPMAENVIEEVGQDEETPKKSSKGKKIGIGCGCGCLVVILLVGGLIFWAYRMATSFVREFEDQGYALVQVQEMVIEEDDVVQGPVVYFGQEITIDGTIDGDVAAMCQQLTINGTINGDLDLLCQGVTISETGVVTGDITAEAVQLLKVDGTVEGEITGTIQVRE